MKRLLFLLLVLICSVTYGQTYQSMPQAGYGPVKRMLFDSVVTLPMGITSLRNITGGRDTAQIRYNKNDSSIYVYTGSQWVKSSGGSTIDTTSLSNRINLKVNISDTANKWISAVSKPNDSSLSFTKGTTVTTYSISSVTSAKRLATLVYNNTGTTIPKGSVVYINGRHSSNLPTIALAQANDEANSYKTFAITAEDIPTSNSGTVIQAGNITGLNLPTSSYTDGDIVYLSPTVAGGITITKPLASNHICKLGSITRAHPTLGSIEIKIENGWQLDELSDVQIPAVPNDSALLQFSRTDSLWHSVSTNTVLNGRMEKKLNISDSSIYYSKFRSDSSRANIYSSINIKLNTSDSAIYYSKFRSDSSRSNIYSSINTKLNTSDSSIYFSKFRSDTMRSNIYTALAGEQDTATSWKTTGNFNVNAGQFIGSRNNASLRLRTNNTERVVIDSIGSVGIGTSLAVASSLVDMTSTTKGLLIPRMSASARTSISSPATGLQVYDLTDSINYAYDGTRWKQYLSNRGNRFASGSDYIGTNNNTSLRFRTNGTERMIIDSVGSIGINTNAPSSTGGLDISSGNISLILGADNLLNTRTNLTTKTFRIGGYNYSNGNPPLGVLVGSSTSTTNVLAWGGGTSIVHAATLQQFFTASTVGVANGTERMRINSAGNVLINTTTDNSNLTVNGSFATGYVAQTANYTATSTDYTINCTANTFQVTLPTAVGITGRIYTIVNSGAGTITIGTTSSQTFVNVATTPTTLTMATVGTRVVQSNGANWLLISSL